MRENEETTELYGTKRESVHSSSKKAPKHFVQLLTPEQISWLTPEQIGWLTPEQIGWLIPEQIIKLLTSGTIKLSKEERRRVIKALQELEGEQCT